MPKLTIDGQEIVVDAGTSVIQAAEKLGISIPRYCYHPGLSIAGSCRMCLVEIEKVPKLQIACYTRAADGMIVHTKNDKVKQARRYMLEFLLTDHPLDCPVCDQSGECDLQNFYMSYGRYESRFLEDKHKKKKATPIGPHVNLDQERCILCSRCTRFTEEVSKSHELGIFNRGDRSRVDLHPGKSLENAYSGNVIDICPVGALTERDFRFKCRVWYLAREESICTGCARGCNVTIQFNGTQRDYKADGKRVQRLKPRFNPKVNQWWMCDEGRFGYEFIDEGRIEFSSQRAGEAQEPLSPDDALAKVTHLVRSAGEKFGFSSIGVLASPQQSNEELLLTKKLFEERLQAQLIGFKNPAESPGSSDDFLISADKNPNSAGAEALGFPAIASSVTDFIDQLKVLVVFHHDLDATVRAAIREAGIPTIFVGSNWNDTAHEADIVLAAATHAEKDGTFTNCDGLIQRFKKALPTLEESRGEFEIILDLAESLGHPFDYLNAEDIFIEWRGKPFNALEPFGEPFQGVPV